jgi:hypothetical protein
MSFVDWLLSTLATGSALLVAGYLGRSLISHWFLEHLLKERSKHEADLQSKAHKHEEHLEDLKTECAKELHTLQSELTGTLSQRSLVFARLHERRFLAIEKVFAKLLPLRDAVGALLSPYQPVGADRVKQTEAILAAHAPFREAVSEGRLFLPRHLAAAVDKIDGELRSLTNVFNLVVNARSNAPDVNRWMELVSKFQGELKETIHQLEEDMRTALGDAPSPPASAPTTAN